MRRLHTILITIMLMLGSVLTGCTPEGKPDVLLPESIEINYFYDEACGSCDGVTPFLELFNEAVGDAKDQYPYKIFSYNLFETSGRAAFEKLAGEVGFSAENLSPPFMVINSKVFVGLEAISNNLREAFLVAGEDIFVNKEVYLPARDAGKPLFEGYVPEKDGSTIAYFYRTTCDECDETKPVIDALPTAITLSGKELPLQVIRFNTRSGRNGERINAFFTAYNVPEEEQKVPIVFLADGYLAGHAAIEAHLEEQLNLGYGQKFSFPDIF